MDAVLAPGFLAAVQARGAYLMKELAKLSDRHGLGEVRGRGLLVALDLKRDIASKVAEIARDRGLLFNAPRPSVVRFMPALNVTDNMLARLDQTLHQVTLDAT